MSCITGRVKWFNSDGFKSLQENDRVEFEVREGPKGLQAANVTKV